MQEDPLLDWSKKYITPTQQTRRGLEREEIATFGKQILEAIIFLRNKIGFPSLGHIHTGNIFVTSGGKDNECGTCRLGGYDNSLLSYRTRIYRGCERAGLVKNIDMIMFGEHILIILRCHNTYKVHFHIDLATWKPINLTIFAFAARSLKLTGV